MAQINNGELIKGMRDNAKILQNESAPNQLAEKVVPVMETNPLLLRRINIHKLANAANATSATIYTTPTDRDFYLTSVSLDLIKDVTATSLNSSVNVTVKGGVSQAILVLRTTTLTIETQNAVLLLPIPMLLERGSNITVTNTTNVANVTASAIITGYVVD